MSNSKKVLAAASLLLASVSSFASEAGDRALALALSLSESATPAVVGAKNSGSTAAVANAVKAQTQAAGLRSEGNASQESK